MGNHDDKDRDVSRRDFLVASAATLSALSFVGLEISGCGDEDGGGCTTSADCPDGYYCDFSGSGAELNAEVTGTCQPSATCTSCSGGSTSSTTCTSCSGGSTSSTSCTSCSGGSTSSTTCTSCSGGSTSSTSCTSCSGGSTSSSCTDCGSGCSASCRDSCHRSCSGTCSGGCKNMTS